MEEQILKLCKRLNKFKLKHLEILSEVPKAELLPILSKFFDENKLIKQENEYLFQKSKLSVQKYSIFKTYPAIINDIVLRCFCENINSIKTSHIVNIGEDQVQKIYTIFRTLIYQRQKQNLDFYYLKSPQKARHRKFFNQEVYLYLYSNQIFVSENLLKSSEDKTFSTAQKVEFTTIYCYLSRNLTHNKMATNLNCKIAETLWRRKREFKDLYYDLKLLAGF